MFSYIYSTTCDPREYSEIELMRHERNDDRLIMTASVVVPVALAIACNSAGAPIVATTVVGAAAMVATVVGMSRIRSALNSKASP